MTSEIIRRIEQIKRGEVPEGYKKTAIGAIPCDWTETRLGDIYTERKEPGNESLPLLMVSIHTGVSDGEVDEDSTPKKVKRIEDKSQYKRAASGDLVFNMMRAWQGAIGTVRTEGMVSPAYVVAMPNDMVVPLFMDYYIRTPRMIGTINRQSYGVTDFRKRLYWDSFAPISCTLPTIKEQDKIAEILATQDRVIELKEKLLEEKKNQKKYLMQQLLTGKKRLPGFSDEWENVQFKDCITEIDERSIESGQYEILSVTKNGIEKQTEHFNQQIASKDNSGYKIIKYNQLAFSILNLWMGSLGVLKSAKIGIVSPAYKVYDFTKKMLPDFGKYFLRSHNIVWLYNINSEVGASVVRKNLDLNSLMNSIIQIPSISEQEKIAQVIDFYEKELSVIQKSINQEKQKKKALMQLLLTGIARV